MEFGAIFIELLQPLHVNVFSTHRGSPPRDSTPEKSRKHGEYSPSVKSHTVQCELNTTVTVFAVLRHRNNNKQSCRPVHRYRMMTTSAAS